MEAVAQIDGRIVDGQLLGLRPQVQRVTGTTALEAVELVLVEVGGETATGAGSRAMQRTRTALLAAARAVGLEAEQLLGF